MADKKSRKKKSEKKRKTEKSEKKGYDKVSRKIRDMDDTKEKS